MKTAKKVLALLLVVIALFSVMTVAAGAVDADPELTVQINSASSDFFGKVTEQLTMIGEWCAGAGLFCARVALAPIIWIISQFVPVDF